MTLGTLRGALAGAAGTTALNGATYLDMALRARPASESTTQLVEETADRASISIPGDEDERGNRVQGLGSWTVEDWASDAVPHLLYGIVTTAVPRTGGA